MLNNKAKQIFSRQITLPEVGEKGQEELEDTGILIVGMGGLGCPVAHYLISSGIGYLTIMDPDKVELSNLSRQPLYAEKDVGKYKVKVAKEVLSKINTNAVINALPGVSMLQFPLSLDSEQLAPATFEVIVTFCWLPDIVEAHPVSNKPIAKIFIVLFTD